MTKIDLVDVGGGNIGSVRRCLELLNVDFACSDINNPPSGNRPVLLPGVGAFGPVMEHLKTTGFDRRVKDLVQSGTPYLGICVGMQILFDTSEEAPGVPGLGLVSGSVKKFRQGKVPQIGWNLIELVGTEAQTISTSQACSPPVSDSQDFAASGAPVSPGFPASGYVYFVNSFYPEPASESDMLYACNYYVRFCAAVQRGNITAFQFHPEKSGAFGKTLLTRWLESVS